MRHVTYHACIRRDQNIDDARRKLHWIPIEDIITFKLLLITYKIRYGIAPDYLAELLTECKPTRDLRSDSQSLFHRPPTRDVATKYYGERSFSVAAPSMWNKLPFANRNADSLITFKRLLKTHLFKFPT